MNPNERNLYMSGGDESSPEDTMGDWDIEPDSVSGQGYLEGPGNEITEDGTALLWVLLVVVPEGWKLILFC